MDEVYVFPTSYAQRRLWFLDSLEPGNSFYNLSDVVHLHGAAEVGALECALSEVVRRHESLRTTFCLVEGRPVQIIRPRLRLNLPVTDLRHLSPEEREAEAARLALAEHEQPFDLLRGPLWRARLLWLQDEEGLLLVAMHHIVSDGWSMTVFKRELLALYEAFLNEAPSPLPEPPVQYADYAVWQREWLEGGAAEGQLTYWRSRLAGAPTVLDLPADKPRPPVQSFRGGALVRRFPAGLSEALSALARGEGATLFMALLAGFCVLLSRYSGRDDLLVGTPIAGRGRSELEGLIGFFVNTLVVRADLSGDPTFAQLVGRVREACLGAYAHQDVPFEQVVEELQPERDPSRNPLFQVMFQFISAEAEADEEEADECAAPDSGEDEVETGTAKFDLGIDVWEDGRTLAAGIEYSTDLFNEDTARRMLRHYECLLAGAAAHPELRISELPLLTSEDHRQLRAWNATARTYPQDLCFPQLFEEQVGRSPDAVAVVSATDRLTYRELNARANRLARYLRRSGVGAEMCVGVCVNRSPDMIVAILAVLKAGGAYVPLDPAYPAERLTFMLDDASAGILLTEESLLGVVGAHTARVVCLDRDSELIARESDENPLPAARPENLAYVIYTSGSTGHPKGVMIRHRSLTNWTIRAAVEYGIVPSDRVLQFSSISFDASVEEIFPCLSLGAILVLHTDRMPSSGRTFLERCGEQGITILDVPTAYWHELAWEISSHGLQLPDSVRLVIFGGEKALSARLAAWRRGVREGVRLMHGYGPTEVTVVATIADLTADDDEAEPLAVSIGRPIGNARVHVLGARMGEAPVGVAGELYVGGEGLARGYLGRPALTAERFLPDPFSAEPGARLYRTGDVARRRADGELEFLGRVDRQVKLRGYRVEPGEVEAALRRHPAVRDAVVTPRTDARGELSHLVGYVTTAEPGDSLAAELRRHLAELLPEHMVPSSLTVLNEFPLKPSGKIDHSALPDPGELQRAEPYAAPEGEAEEVIAEAWREVFGLERVSAHANFFDLGGHSLTLVRVHARLRERLHVDLPLIDMFRFPTIRSLAAKLGRGPQASESVFGPDQSQPRERAERRHAAASRKSRAARQRSLTHE